MYFWIEFLQMIEFFQTFKTFFIPWGYPFKSCVWYAGQLPDTSEELLKLDQVFIKSELKVGVIYVKEGQPSASDENIIFTNP